MASGDDVRYVDAIRLALETAMRDDDSVVVLGQDVTSGGPFGATRGLVDEFGAERVRDTPISENTIAGMAVGAALLGRRPVLELMFMDFVTLALDQLANHAAKLEFMSGGQLRVPLTVRVQGGAIGGFGAHHSQCLEAWLAHVPGLRVVAPSTPADACDLLASAIASDEPTIVVEHRALYWDRAPIGRTIRVHPPDAVVRRAGTDVSIITWSRMCATSLAAAEMLSTVGISAEVLDLRTLSPIDVAGIVDSVRRTGRAIVASEAVAYCDVGAEVVAAIAIALGPEAPVHLARVGAPRTPVPAAVHLEADYVPSAERIAEAATRLVEVGADGR